MPHDYKAIIFEMYYDYFFHVLLNSCPSVRLFLCRYVSGDHSIKETFVENGETFKPHYKGKKLILDVVVRDDKDNYYDFEMQNGTIDEEDMIRFVRYGERLIDLQETRGLSLSNIRDVRQVIFYTGRPLDQYEQYYHLIQKGDIQNQLLYSGDKVAMELYQLRKLKEEYDMAKALSPMEQFNYLMYYGEFPKGKVLPVIEEIKAYHEKFLRDPIEIMKARELELERQLIEAKMKKNRKEGEAIGKDEGLKEGEAIGEKKGQIKSVKTLIQSLYGEVDTSWVDECSEEQLMKALTITRNNFTYEEFKEEVMLNRTV